MATPNSELTQKARETLSGKWNEVIPAYLIYMVLNSVGGGISLVIGGPLQLGTSIYSLNIARGKKAELGQILDGFKKFAESLIAFLLISLYVMLWAILLIIPGIIAALGYSQTFFIMADDPKISGMDAMKKSKEMMKGNKWKLFCLGWRFFGWTILAVLTLGIGFLWLMPYMQVSFANFYEDIKK